MPNRTAVIALAMSLAFVGGCKKASVDAHDATPQDVASQVAASDLRPQAGRWEGTFRIEKMEMSGVPPQAQAMMQGAVGKSRAYASCLTKEEAEKPAADFFGRNDKDCRYEHFTMSGGKIDARLDCASEGTKMSMTMAGTYSGSAYALRSTAKGDMPGGHTMTTVTAMESHRVGECRGDEDS